MDERPDDELASAYLDGEATPDERALVDGDPALLARVEELRAAAALLAETPAPLAASVVDAQIALALAAASSGAAGRTSDPVPTEAPAAVVVPLRQRATQTGQWAAAIAAVGVLLIAFASFFGGEASSQFSSVGGSISGAGGMALSGDDGPQPEAAEGGTLAPPADDDMTEGVGGEDVAAFDTAALAPELPDLEPVTDDEELAAAVSATLEPSGAADLRNATGDGSVGPATSTTQAPPPSTIAPSTTVPSMPSTTASAAPATTCTTRTADLHAIAAQAMVVLYDVFGVQPVAIVDAVVDDVAVKVVLLAPDPTTPVLALLVVDPTGCTPPRVLPVSG